MAKLLLFLGVVIAIGAVGFKLQPGASDDLRHQFYAATNLAVEDAADARLAPTRQPDREQQEDGTTAAAAESIRQADPDAVAAARVELLPIEKKSVCQNPQYVDVYDEDGTGKSAYYCADVTPQHPYERYPSATLETMAYSDAKAADILGRRLSESDPAQSFEWMIRATALGKGDYQPIMFMLNQNYASPTLDGEVLLEVARKRYVLAKVMQQLGGPASSSQHTAELLVSAGVSPEAMATLDRAAEQVLKKISAIAYEVTGEKFIAGARAERPADLPASTGIDPQHPYTNYSTTILETMAFDDAKAAEVLGVRLRTSDPGQSMEWLLRATALSNGDYHPFLWLVNNSYSEVIAHAEVDYDIVIPRYLLTRVIQLLGGPAAPVENTAEFLLSHGMPAESLAQLDAGAAQMMEKIAAIAYEVTGERMLIASRVNGTQ